MADAKKSKDTPPKDDIMGGRCYKLVRIKGQEEDERSPMISEVSEIAGVRVVRLTRKLVVRHYPRGDLGNRAYWKNFGSPGHVVPLELIKTGTQASWLTMNPLGFLPGAN